MLFFCFVYVTLFLRICAQESNINKTNVPGPQMTCPDHRTTLFFVALNENHCYLTDSWASMEVFACTEGTSCLRPSDCKKRYFEYCLPRITIYRLQHDRRCDGDCVSVIVPEYFRSNLPEVFKNEVFRGDNFTVINCNYQFKTYFGVNKPFYFYYGGQPNPNNNTQQTTQFVEQSSSTPEETLVQANPYTNIQQTTESVESSPTTDEMRGSSMFPEENNVTTKTETVEQNNGTTNGTIDFSASSSSNGKIHLYLYIGAGVAVFVVIVIAQTFCIVRYRKRVSNTKRTLDVVLCSQEEKMNDKSVRYSTGPELRRMVKNTKTNKNIEEEVYASIESLEDDIDPRPVRKAPQIPQSSPNEMPDGYLEPITVKQSQITVKQSQITVKQSQTRPRLPLPHELEPSGLDVREMPQMTSPSGALQVRAQPPPISPKPRLPHPQTPSFQPRPVLPPHFQPYFTPAVNFPRHSFAPMSYRPPTTDPRFHPLPPPPMSSSTSSAFDTSDEEWTYEKLPPFEAYLH